MSVVMFTTNEKNVFIRGLILLSFMLVALIACHECQLQISEQCTSASRRLLAHDDYSDLDTRFGAELALEQSTSQSNNSDTGTNSNGGSSKSSPQTSSRSSPQTLSHSSPQASSTTPSLDKQFELTPSFGPNDKSADFAGPWVIPPEVHDPSWVVQTEVRPSAIEEAGNGRFALERIPKGTTMLKRKMLHGWDSRRGTPPLGVVVASSNEASLLKALTYPDVPGKPTNAKQIVHFANVPGCEECYATGKISSNGKDYKCRTCDGTGNVVPEFEGVFHWVPSGHVNHHDNANIEQFRIDEHTLGVRAIRDIEAGGEIYSDYRIYGQQPKWFLDYCEKQQVTNAKVFAHELSGPKQNSKESRTNEIFPKPAKVSDTESVKSETPEKVTPTRNAKLTKRLDRAQQGGNLE